MKGRIREMAENLKALKFEELCAEAVIENEKYAADLNTQQLFQGERSDGSSMPDYSFVSVNFYNKPAGPIRLFDTGAFYGGFVFASKTGTAQFPLFITSTDSKSKELEGRYGKQIFGLTEQNLSGFARVYVLPSVGKKLREYMGL